MSEETLLPGPELTLKQKKFLKGLAHPLSPVVKIGKEGITARLLETIENELLYHELIKVKIGNNSDVKKTAAAQLIPEKTGSSLVQLIGKTLILYKANSTKQKDKRIAIPRA